MPQIKRFGFCTKLVFCSALLVLSSVVAAERIALVIGNSKYQYSPVLANPVNDTEAVAKALTAMGFVVSKGFNLKRDDMEELLYAFGEQAENAQIALLYYAGHGIQVNGHNYLIPVDMKLN